MRDCKFRYNEINFDDAIPGFTTAKVTGRGSVTNNIETVDVPSRHGSHYIGSKIENLEITVRYIIKALTRTEFRRRVNILNKYLHEPKGLVKFSFTDENGYYRNGVLGNVVAPEFNQYQGDGEFTLICPDPFKYKDIPAFTSDRIPSFIKEPLVPERMTLETKGSSSNVQILNVSNGRRIKLNISTSYGDVFTFEKERIYKNKNNDMLKYLDLFSDYEDFEINYGDKIELKPNGVLTIEARRRSL